MSQFAYEGIDHSGEKTSGVINADNFRSAARELEQRNLKIISLDPVKQTRNKALSKGKVKISKDDVILIFYEIATMLRAGVSLKEAVEAQCESSHSDAVLGVFESLLKQLKSGSAFSAAVRNTELQVPDYMYHLIESGEMTGGLAEAIEQGVEQMEYDLKVQSETRSALIYPSILVLSGIIAVGIMFLFVVPKFSSLLSDADDMPALAWLVISSGVWVNDNKLGVLIGFVVAIGATVMVLT